jgi:hypothetical protein
MISQSSRRILVLFVFLAIVSSTAWAAIDVSPPSEPFPDVFVGNTFSQQFFSSVSGVTWSISAGQLPPGITLNPTTGVASGQLLQGGSFAFNVTASTSNDSGSASYFINVIVGPLTVNSNTFNPRASTGALYSSQISATGGAPPYTWSLATTVGANGLSVSNTGMITGTPTTPGVTTLNVVVTDSQHTTVTSQLPLFVIGITSTSLPPAALGVAYTQTLTVAGAQTPVTWVVTGVNPLPPGFALSAQGVLGGISTTSGIYNFTVSVTDSIQNTATAKLTLAIGSTFSILTTSPLPNAAIGVNYSQVLQAAGGTAPYTWTATSLPPGITLDASTGNLHGTPSTPGTQSIAVTATDTTLATAHANLSLTIDSLSITTNTLPTGVVGISYAASLAVSGAQSSLVWSLAGGALPAGLALNSTTGSINGVPTAAGTSTFTVNVTYTPGSVSVQKQFTIQISVASGLTITSNPTLPAGTVNGTYSQTLAASGGRTPYSWNLVSGVLPAGLSVSPNGVITGTPSAAGTTTFTISVSDSAQAFANQAFTLTILPTTLDFTSSLRIAQVVDGGNFVTQFAIVNLSGLPVSYQFRFWGDNGSTLNLPFQNGVNGSLAGTLDAGGIAFAQTTGTSAPSTAAALQGWAEVAATAQVGVVAIFKRSVPGTSDSEATVIGSPSSGSVSLPFDNTQGFATGVALANTNPLQANTINAVFEFENGGSFSTTIALPPHAHTAFTLPSTYPATAGLRGVVHFTAFSQDISAVGLRFSPNNSFTSLGTFQ